MDQHHSTDEPAQQSGHTDFTPDPSAHEMPPNDAGDAADGAPSLTLLESLDRRQNQVLEDLDRLSESIEALVKQNQQKRKAGRSAA